MDFSKITSLFVEEQPTNNKQETKKEKTVSNTNTVQETKTFVQQQSPSSQISENTNTVNQDILNKLCAYMESCDLDGPDFLEFKKAVNSAGMLSIPDIGIRYQAAYATMKSMYPTFNKSVILNSIDVYINKIKEQNNVAKTQIETKRKSEVGDKLIEIENKETKIKQLTEEITKIATEVSMMKESVQKADEECDRNITDFETAVNIIVSNLESDKKTISEKIQD